MKGVFHSQYVSSFCAVDGEIDCVCVSAFSFKYACIEFIYFLIVAHLVIYTKG